MREYSTIQSPKPKKKTHEPQAQNPRPYTLARLENHMTYRVLAGNFHKYVEPNIDPNILYSLLQGPPPQNTPKFGKSLNPKLWGFWVYQGSSATASGISKLVRFFSDPSSPKEAFSYTSQGLVRDQRFKFWVQGLGLRVWGLRVFGGFERLGMQGLVFRMGD